MFKLEGDTIICSPSEQRGTTHVLVLLNFETTRLVGDCLSWTVRAHVPRVIQIEVRYLSKAGGLLTPVGYTKGGVGVSDFSGWSPLPPPASATQLASYMPSGLRNRQVIISTSSQMRY